MTQIPRPEHPQPQMKREHWKNLNGEWDFSFDFGCSGIDQKWQEGKTDWEKKILVPFCPESDLSGIGYKDFIPGVWYHRTITLTGEELKGDLLLHFGAVDYDASAQGGDQRQAGHNTDGVEPCPVGHGIPIAVGDIVKNLGTFP